jgi:anti-anti-sigma factor
MQAVRAEEVLNISVESDDDRGAAVVVNLRGDLDFGTGPEFRARLSDVVDSATDVVVDLSGVDFLDPAGLAALLGARKEAARCGASLILRSPPRRIARILATSGADQLVPIEW